LNHAELKKKSVGEGVLAELNYITNFIKVLIENKSHKINLKLLNSRESAKLVS